MGVFLAFRCMVLILQALHWTQNHEVLRVWRTVAQDMGVPVSKMEESIEASLKRPKILMEGRTPLTRAVSHGVKPLARQAQGRSSTTTSFLGGNSLLDCVVCARVAGAACAKYSRRLLVEARVKSGQTNVVGGGLDGEGDSGIGLRSVAYYVATSRQSSNAAFSGP